ncbi:hypothetical protein, partial [Neisseria meningitidis]|uniref:hypothetical protein n=1 Tax=Neisseria meningitidis TaxID=487 RepID=UPI001C8F785F
NGMWVRGNDDGKFAVVSDNTEAFRLHSYSGLTKTGTALPRLDYLYCLRLRCPEAPSESVSYWLYCLRLRRLVLIFVNALS